MRTNKFSNFSLLILLFLILNSLFFSAYATVRYVSHTGNSTPPYTSWATAADSIQKCINICFFGDTIYVANGVYEEQVIMIPGLSLIGAGMDSCTIDTRSLDKPLGFASVIVKDNSVFKNFQVIVANSRTRTAIKSYTATANIESNKLINAHWGILARLSNSSIINNLFQNFETGISITNSESFISNNQFLSVDRGIEIDAFASNYYPIIDKNIISCESIGILVQLGSRSTIRNNIIFLTSDFADGYTGGGSDTAWVYNNLIVAQGNFNDTRGLNNSIVPTFNTNNFLIGQFGYKGIDAENLNIIKNNSIINSPKGIIQDPGDSPIIQYNNSWNNTVNYGGFTPDSTNLSVDPMIVSEDSLDFHLQKYSPLIDAGDPNILDRDGSRSDIGLYGGPYGWSYTYQDLAPRPPHNVTAVIEDGLVKLNWNKNTEADFSHYRIYRDTISIVIYDSSKIVGETPDTVFYDNLPPVNRETSFYYLITAFDNHGNQSYPSEEISVTVTGLSEHPPIGYDDYRLLSNYPNPFNPSTIIPYRLKEGGYVKLYIYDIKGELVKTLVNEWQEKGYYEVTFHPNVRERQKANSFEVPMGKTYGDTATGVYIYQIIVKSERNIPVFSDMGKMILLK